jgi:hypothetical protein
MIIQINPKEFVNEFINPINELNREGKIALFCDGTNLYSISATKSRTINLYNTYKPLHTEDPVERSSLNVLKLIKGLGCVANDEMFVSLDISKENNTLTFATKEIRFNIRLLDDNLVEVPKFNLEVFKKFSVHHEVNINSSKVVNIKKALEFSAETSKFYIEQEDGDVFFYFGDKSSTSNHTDDIKIHVAEGVTTKVPNKIYDVDILRLVLKSKNDFSMKLNDNGVMYIEIENNNSNLKYITTPLIK